MPIPKAPRAKLRRRARLPSKGKENVTSFVLVLRFFQKLLHLLQTRAESWNSGANLAAPAGSCKAVQRVRRLASRWADGWKAAAADA